MMAFFWVFLGGGLGSICRYGIGLLLQPYKLQFPYATLIANAISCVILGILIGLSLKNQLHQRMQLLLMTGFCGGFSTFSTFSSETFLLFEQGQLNAAFFNIFGSVIIGLIGIYFGLKLVH
ncbi:MAG: fluoride efflux transporter CrcB [Bacteroidota bacterium]